MAFWNELVSIADNLFRVLRNIYDGLSIPMAQAWGENSFVFNILSSILSIFGFNLAEMSIIGFVLSVVVPFIIYFHILKFFKDLIF